MSTKTRDWTSTGFCKPTVGKPIEWMDSAGTVNRGKFLGGVIWMLDGGMYVYYEPKFWRYL